MRLALLFAALLVAACATQGERTTGGETVRSSQSATASGSAASLDSATPGASAAPVAADASGQPDFAVIDASNIAEAQQAGYKVVNQNGTMLLCRKDLITGTRLRYKTTCLTAEQWREQALAARESVTPSQVSGYSSGR